MASYDSRNRQERDGGGAEHQRYVRKSHGIPTSARKQMRPGLDRYQSMDRRVFTPADTYRNSGALAPPNRVSYSNSKDKVNTTGQNNFKPPGQEGIDFNTSLSRRGSQDHRVFVVSAQPPSQVSFKPSSAYLSSKQPTSSTADLISQLTARITALEVRTETH